MFRCFDLSLTTNFHWFSLFEILCCAIRFYCPGQFIKLAFKSHRFVKSQNPVNFFVGPAINQNCRLTVFKHARFIPNVLLRFKL